MQNPESSLIRLDPARLRLLLFLVTGAMFMEILDGAIIAPALPAMAQAFGTSALQLNIGISAYLLAVGIFVPASGWIAERFGTRRIFMLAIILFTISSALCALATSLDAFVALRILQGCSGALMVPVGRLVILKYTPQENLMAAMSALIWPALVAPVIGPPLGGFITQHLGWHWIFLLNVPLGMVALAVARIVVPDIRAAQPRSFDWPGFLLCASGTFSLLLGLEWLTQDIDPISCALMLAGVLLLWAAVRHFRRSSTPMLNLSVFGVRTFRVAMLGGSLSRMAIGSAPFLLTLMFQVGFGYDAFHAGLLVLTVFAGNLLMKTVTTPILRRFGYRRVLLVNGWLCATSLAACALLQPGTSWLLMVPLLVVGGMTRSMQFTALGTLGFADVPKTSMADANGLFNTVSQLTMAAGITLAAMFVRTGHALAELGGSAQTAAGYQIAFVFLGLIVLCSLLEIRAMPAGAGDHFIARK
jgi:EmrB/QacA subfamily drug resistance transporter